jgi:hypothetical protein
MGERRESIAELPMGLKRSLLRSLLAMCLCVGVAEAQTTVRWIHPVADWNGRVYEWDVQGSKMLLAQPVSEEIATTARAGGGAPKLQLGFRHSGYTGSDEDGRNALLTLSVVDRSLQVSPRDLDALVAQGYTLNKSFALNTSSDWSLDVQLAGDVVEEQRIRTLLHLPLRVTLGATIVPFSIRWANIDGDKLYSWLTDANKGLKFVLTNGAWHSGR